MARRLILDTGVLIDSERGAADVYRLIEPEDDVAIATVTVAELRTGVELASARHRRAREVFVDRVLATIPVVPYDEETARAHALLLAQVHRTGTKRGAHDLIIAATAVATNRAIVTGDRLARFADLPNVTTVG